MNVIGLCGPAGAGKDTVGRLLEHRLRGRCIAFADPLKQALSAMLEVDREAWDDREWKERELPGIGVSPRVLAQTLGTEWGRETISPTLWVDLARERMLRDPRQLWVLTDVRFDNEAEIVRELGGWLVRVHRPQAAPVAEHVSESALTHEPDYVIDNSGTLEELRSVEVPRFCAAWLSRPRVVTAGVAARAVPAAGR